MTQSHLPRHKVIAIYEAYIPNILSKRYIQKIKHNSGISIHQASSIGEIYQALTTRRYNKNKLFKHQSSFNQDVPIRINQNRHNQTYSWSEY